MSLSYIPRVTQLDALQLDNQLEELFKQQIFNATQYLEPGILQPFLPELELIIRTWLFKYSVWDSQSTFGQQILSLNYKKDNFSRSKLYWYYGYTVGLKYFKDRAIYSYTSNIKVQNFITKLETFQVIGDVMNFLRFIQNGKHPLLIDFILGLELTAEKLTREDLTDLSWTRELLWHNIIELISTMVSLSSAFGLQQKMLSTLKYFWWKSPSTVMIKGEKPVMTLSTVCACCSQPPVLPHVMGCSHIFCYYCLSANKLADQDYECPKCFFNGKEVAKYVVE